MQQSSKKIFSDCCSVLLRTYRFFIAPVFLALGVRCRFEPSCSHFAEEAIKIHGFRGVFLSITRLAKCHPFCEGGWDPVPPQE